MSAFPAQNAPDQAELLRRYLDVVEDWHADLVEEAVTLYTTGAMPGFDGRFAPTPPMLATGCRKAAENQARRKYLDGLNAPRLPAPQLQRTDESRERVREKMKAAVEAIGAQDAHVAAEDIAYSKERWAKTNARFQPDMSDEAVMDRLVRKRGFEVGNDGEEFAA